MLKLAFGTMCFVAGAVTMLVILTNDMDDNVFDAWLTQEDKDKSDPTRLHGLATR